MLAVRADFYGRCAAYPELSRLLGANHVLVGPMSRDELRRAIERPAQRVGLSVEPELVEALLADVEGQPGALPLLSTALLELWRERDGRRLRLAAYARSGGVHGAVARLAEEAYVALDPEQQAAARTLLLRLADEDESGAVVRRRIALAELGDEHAEVVEQLTDRRLLTVSDGTVEVAHEALLREWPRLRAWLDEDAEGRRLHRRLGDAARAWDADARDPGGLYRGARLAAALDWAAGHDAELNPTERAFLDASRQRERARPAPAAADARRRRRAARARRDRRPRRARPARRRARRGDHGRGAAARRPGALGRRPRPRAAARPPGRGARRLARRRAATCSPRCSRAPPRSACSAATATRWRASTSARTGARWRSSTTTGALARVDPATRRRQAPRRGIPGFLGGPFGVDVMRFSDDGSLLAVAGPQPVVLDAATGRTVDVAPDVASRGSSSACSSRRTGDR